MDFVSRDFDDHSTQALAENMRSLLVGKQMVGFCWLFVFVLGSICHIEIQTSADFDQVSNVLGCNAIHRSGSRVVLHIPQRLVRNKVSRDLALTRFRYFAISQALSLACSGSASGSTRSCLNSEDADEIYTWFNKQERKLSLDSDESVLGPSDASTSAPNGGQVKLRAPSGLLQARLRAMRVRICAHERQRKQQSEDEEEEEDDEITSLLVHRSEILIIQLKSHCASL